jgi:predicted DNA-binding antitoxin AbrB/MazE fold protein
MVHRGHVENGVIRLEDWVALPEGPKVRVEVLPPVAERDTQAVGLSLYERLKPVVGAAKDLPADASVNVDHYLYGHPKK